MKRSDNTGLSKKCFLTGIIDNREIMISPVNSPGSPGMPQGLMLPDIIITRRTRTISMNGRIEEDVHEGTVRFFCRSKGHGFIDDDIATATAEAKVCSWNCTLYPQKNGILKIVMRFRKRTSFNLFYFCL